MQRSKRFTSTNAARPARLTALVSKTVWISVIVLGGAMGYERRKPPEVDLDALPEFGAVLPAEPLSGPGPDGMLAADNALGAD